jgi:hypothetical protein
MTNKTVIRKEKKTGEFTTIHNSILNDSRLSATALRLLLSILSDSDTFRLSQSLYKQRLGITENRTFLKAIANLEECGYLKKTEVGKGVFIPNIKKANSDKIVYHYTISEYGNLKSETKPEPEVQPEVVKESIGVKDKETLMKRCKDLIKQNSKLFNNDISFLKIAEAYGKGIYDIAIYQKIIDEEKELQKSLKHYYKDVLGWIQDLIKPEHTKALKEFEEWLKDEVFNKRNTNLGRVSVRSTYGYLSLLKYKKEFKTDYETEMGDYYENPID